MALAENQISPEDDIKVVWVGSDVACTEMVGILLDHTEIAVDTEFRREKTYYPRLALLQLGVNGLAFLVDPFQVDMTLLAPLFESNVEFVFHALEQDLDIIERACGVRAKVFFDTQIAAGFIGLSRPSLAHLADRLLGVELPKADRLSDWTQRPLTEAQKIYAASDVAHLLVMKAKISEELESAGRLAWALDEFEYVSSRRKEPTDPALAWQKIKECRSLKGNARKVAKSVAQWREERAIELDIPPRYLLSDLTVAAIAQLAPKTKQELLKVRGIDPRQINNGTDVSILEAVKAGLLLDKVPDIPHQNDDGIRGAGAVVSLCLAWLSQKCNDERFDPTIVGTREDVTQLLAGEKDSRLGTGWRYELIGRQLLEIKSAKLSLTGGPGGKIVAIPIEE